MVQSESSTLKFRLIVIFLLFCILPMTAIGVYSYRLIENQILSTNLSNLEAIAKIKAGQIEYFYQHIGADLGNVAETDAVIQLIVDKAGDDSESYRQAKKIIQGQLEKFIEKMSINEIHILDINGNPIVSSFNDSFEYGASPLKTAFQKGKSALFFSDIYESIYENKRFAFAIGKPLADKKGNTIGVIVAEAVADSYFELIKDETGLGRSGETLLAQKIGAKTLFLTPLKYDKKAGLVRSVDIDSNIAAPAILAANKNTGSGLSKDYRGVDVAAAWRYIPSVGFGIVSKIDAREVFEPLLIAKASMIGATLLVVIFGVIFSLYLANKIAMPIRSLEQKAKCDALTGLLNRSALDEALKRVIAQAKENRCMSAVVLVDLDGFKSINDTHGHEVGDIFLKKVSLALSSSVRFNDYVIRLGGDEFVVLLEGVKNIESVKSIVNSMLNSIRALSVREFGSLEVSASIGVSLFPLHTGEAKELLKLADEAMYTAKHSGKNSYKLANSLGQKL